MPTYRLGSVGRGFASERRDAGLKPRRQLRRKRRGPRAEHRSRRMLGLSHASAPVARRQVDRHTARLVGRRRPVHEGGQERLNLLTSQVGHQLQLRLPVTATVSRRRIFILVASPTRRTTAFAPSRCGTSPCQSAHRGLPRSLDRSVLRRPGATRLRGMLQAVGPTQPSDHDRVCVEPRLQVGAARESIARANGLEVGVLNQVLRRVGVARQAHGGAIEPIEKLKRRIGELIALAQRGLSRLCVAQESFKRVPSIGRNSGGSDFAHA